MNQRTKSSVLWGVVAAFSFLVLVQAYQLLGNERVMLGVILVTTVLVGFVSSVLTYITEERLVS